MTGYASFSALARARCKLCDGMGVVDESVFGDPSSPLTRDDVSGCRECCGTGFAPEKETNE